MVTTIDRAPDWKVTTTYRIMLAVGWGAFVLALYLATIALVVAFSLEGGRPVFPVSG